MTDHKQIGKFVTEVIVSYQKGLSTNKIAQKLGISKPTILKILHSVGIVRPAIKTYNESLKEKFPLLCKEWDYELNNSLIPENCKPFSSKKVGWRCKNCQHHWTAAISSRTANKTGCPACSHTISTSENNLAVKFSDLILEWDYEANHEIIPEKVSPFSNRKFSWKCVNSHKWQETVAHRTAMKLGCPYCSGKRPSPDHNLLILFPEIAKELHPDNKINPEEISPFSHHIYKWVCQNNHVWEAPVDRRTSQKSLCPYCSHKLASPEYNLVVLYPELMKEWDYEKNKISPIDLTPGSKMQVFWHCEKEHKWEALIKNRTSPLLLTGCPNCANTHTSLEKSVESYLGIPKFDKCPLNKSEVKYRPDFKLNESIYLNVDGLYWHSDIYRYKKYHLELREAFESEGLRILQFYEDEIRDKWPIVESMINAILGKTQYRIGARECEIREVSTLAACNFLNDNHLQGEYRFAKYFGLWNEGNLLSLMAVRPIRGVLEISRFCTLKNHLVAGGFSRLLQYVIDKFHPPEIISFCDLRYFQGQSYEKAGFTHVSTSLGWCWTDNINRYNRLACRAGDGKSEKEKALERGWIRLYGAGHAKYMMRPVYQTSVSTSLLSASSME